MRHLPKWVSGRNRSRLISDSRVVLGQVWRNRLFLQAFHGSRDRCRLFGESHLISSASILYRVCKTPEFNMSLLVVSLATICVSNQRHELPLGLRIPLDVALRHGQAGMAGQLLHVPEAPPDL